ncbi:MAG: class I SAM-dependent methyltransferase, partial [Caldilineaceae bacterium]|nr:class I SAM-dependent methyltransferase [Caldilineaceae bacterium]
MSTWTSETAEWYARHYGEYATNRLAVDALTFPLDAVIVDVGCGTGAALRHAAGRVTSGSLIGVDPVPRMVEIARERTANHPRADGSSFGLAPPKPCHSTIAQSTISLPSIPLITGRIRHVAWTKCTGSCGQPVTLS